MSKQQDTINEVVGQGKDILQKANSRHVIIRKPDGEKLVDVTFIVAAVVVLALLWFQPIGIFLAFGALAYGLYAKLKMEVVHELGEGDNVVEMRLPKDEEKDS